MLQEFEMAHPTRFELTTYASRVIKVTMSLYFNNLKITTYRLIHYLFLYMYMKLLAKI